MRDENSEELGENKNGKGGPAMKVKDIALKEVVCATPSTNMAEIASMMKRHNIGVIPVCEGQKLLGILTDRDLVITCMAAEMNPRECIAREFLTSNPVIITPETDLKEAAEMMGKNQIRRLPVVESGNLVGMLSMGDVSMALSDEDNMVAEMLRQISSPTHAAVSS